MLKARMFVVALLAGTLLASVAVAAPLFEEDFDSYAVNNYLKGQGGWSVFSGGDFFVRNAIDGWGGTGNLVARPFDSGEDFVKKAASLNISSTGIAILGFDVYYNDKGYMSVGLGDCINTQAY